MELQTWKLPLSKQVRAPQPIGHIEVVGLCLNLVIFQWLELFENVGFGTLAIPRGSFMRSLRLAVRAIGCAGLGSRNEVGA
jgi:hypothetical protein